MLVLNFAHPLTPDQLQRIEALTGEKVDQAVDVPCQLDLQQPLAPQVSALADHAGLTSTEWQTLTLLINPPSLSIIAVTLLAELHGRCGYFPTMLRVRPVQGSIPPRYELAEVLDLQAIRDAARQRRA